MGCSGGGHFHCHRTDGKGEESVRRDICPGSYSAAVQGRDCNTIPKIIFSLFWACILGRGDIQFLCNRLWALQSRNCSVDMLPLQWYDHRYRHIQAISKLPHSPLTTTRSLGNTNSKGVLEEEALDLGWDHKYSLVSLDAAIRPLEYTIDIAACTLLTPGDV